MRIEILRLNKTDADVESKNYMALLYGEDDEEVWMHHTTNVVTKRQAEMVAANMKASYEQGFKDAMSILELKLNQFKHVKTEYTDH
jgi:hypothetical protein